MACSKAKTYNEQVQQFLTSKGWALAEKSDHPPHYQKWQKGEEYLHFHCSCGTTTFRILKMTWQTIANSQVIAALNRQLA